MYVHSYSGKIMILLGIKQEEVSPLLSRVEVGAGFGIRLTVKEAMLV